MLSPVSRTQPALNSTPLRWTATIVRDGSHVLNGANFDSSSRQRADRRFASRTRSAHSHFHAAHTVIARHVGGIHCCLLGSKRRSLTRTPEAERTGTLPRHD